MNATIATKLRQKAAEAHQARQDSFDRCDTDGFVTQHCHGLTAREAEAQARISENDGLSTFRGLYRSFDGVRVAAKLIEGKFGYCWAFCDADGNFTGNFLADSKGTTRSKMFREGFEVREEDAPAWAEIAAPAGAKGFSGLSQCYIRIYRTDGGYPPEAVVV